MIVLALGYHSRAEFCITAVIFFSYRICGKVC